MYPREIIRKRLEEHDAPNRPMPSDCAAQNEDMQCCISPIRFNYETEQWEDNPFRKAIDQLLENERMPNLSALLKPRLMARIYDEDDGTLLAVFPIKQSLSNGDTVRWEFTVNL